MKPIASEPPESRPDYIVVGGGTAGCLIARRLSQQTDASILLIEAGPRQADVRAIVPALYPRLFGSRFDWGYTTEPAAGLNGRSLRWPRGKMLGGCSAVNALIYLQSPETTFTQCKLSAPHWPTVTGQHATCPLSGVRLAPVNRLHPWSEQFLGVAESSGLTRQPAMLTANPGTCGSYWLTQSSDHRRNHIGHNVRDSARLQILTGWTVDCLLVEGERAIGVKIVSPENRAVEIRAAQETVLSAGALGSPELLLRSGIGPAAELQAAGVKCFVDSPRVGKNLQDHLVYPVVYQGNESTGLPRRFDSEMRDAYRTGRPSPLASNIAEAGAILEADSSDHRSVPFQIHCTPTHYLKYPVLPTEDNCMSLGVSPLAPASRGQVRLVHHAGSHRLVVEPCYLVEQSDIVDFSSAIAATRERFSSALGGHGWNELLPGKRGDKSKSLHRSIAAYATSIYHPTSTCCMGDVASSSVVDSEFRVHGLAGIRIADASVFPTIPASNPQAPTLWLATQCVNKITHAGNQTL